MTNYGYLRVSTNKQDIENQKAAILKYANEKKINDVEFISETISSRKADRKIYSLIKKLKAGDNLIIFELSRLARSMKQLSRILLDTADKNATIHAISQNLVISPDHDDIASQAYIFALSLAAQIERNMISDRTKSALAVKKAAGVKLGRPAGSQLDSRIDEIQKYLDKGLNATAISKLMDVHFNTMASWLKKNHKLIKR